MLILELEDKDCEEDQVCFSQEDNALMLERFIIFSIGRKIFHATICFSCLLGLFNNPHPWKEKLTCEKGQLFQQVSQLVCLIFWAAGRLQTKFLIRLFPASSKMTLKLQNLSQKPLPWMINSCNNRKHFAKEYRNGTLTVKWVTKSQVKP